MSLLTEEVAQISESQDLIAVREAYVYPNDHFSLLSGVFKQAIGYCFPRGNDLWYYFIDSKTGTPMKLPDGAVILRAYFTGIQSLPPDSYFYWYILDSPVDPDNSNYYEVDGWYGYNYNNKIAEKVSGGKGSGLDYPNYNYVALYNDYAGGSNISSGGVKVVVEYF